MCYNAHMNMNIKHRGPIRVRLRFNVRETDKITQNVVDVHCPRFRIKVDIEDILQYVL